MKDFVKEFNQLDFISRFIRLPRRVFLDSNIIQYFVDFGDFIFDKAEISGIYFFNSRGNKIDKSDSLYWEILCLRQISLLSEKTYFESVVSDHSYFEIIERKDKYLTGFF